MHYVRSVFYYEKLISLLEAGTLDGRFSVQEFYPVGGGGGTIQVREGTIQCITFCFLNNITGSIDNNNISSRNHSTWRHADLERMGRYSTMYLFSFSITGSIDNLKTFYLEEAEGAIGTRAG